MKYIVFILFAAIIISLGSGLYYLSRDDAGSSNVLRAQDQSCAFDCIDRVPACVVFYGLDPASERLYPINKHVQTNPDHVNKVPVPGNSLKCEMLVRSKVALQHPKPNGRKHDGADSYVHTVETGEHEER